MNIVDALIQKGSTGGNNIAEAIENLPEFGVSSGSGVPSSSGAGLPAVTAASAGKALVVGNDGKWRVSKDVVSKDSTVWEFNGTGSEFVDAFEWTLFDFPTGSGGTMPVLLAPIDATHTLFDTNNFIEYLYYVGGEPDIHTSRMDELFPGAYSSLGTGGSFALDDVPGGFISGDFSSIGGHSSVTAIVLVGQWSGVLEDDLATLQTVASNVDNLNVAVKDIRQSSKVIIPVVISKTFDSNDSITTSVNLSYDELYAIYVDNNQTQLYTKLPVFFDNGKPVTGYLQYNGSNQYVEIVTNDLAVESDSVYVNEMKYRVNYNDKVWIAGNTSYPVTTGTATTGYTEQSPK